MSKFETTLVVHASPTALKAFKTGVLPALLARGIELRREEATALCLHETKPSESFLSDVCHGISLILPALSLFVNLNRGTGGQQLWYVSEGETLAYRQVAGADNPDGPVREYGPVNFMEGAFAQFCPD